MSALPPDDMRAMSDAAQDASQPLPGSLARKWQDLHKQAEQLAMLAAISPEPFTGRLAEFPVLLAEASAAQCTLASQGIEDIDAMMQPGLTALKVITARGKDASVPALALWREFHAARGAVLDAVGGPKPPRDHEAA